MLKTKAPVRLVVSAAHFSADITRDTIGNTDSGPLWPTSSFDGALDAEVSNGGLKIDGRLGDANFRDRDNAAGRDRRDF
jgi:hypothetical protein